MASDQQLNTNHLPVSSQKMSDVLSANKNKISLVANQLLLLLHSEECRQNQLANPNYSCSFKQCQMFQDVLRHLASCLNGRECSTAFCSSSLRIISHYRHCKSLECPVCQPVKIRIHHSNLMQNIINFQRTKEKDLLASKSNNSVDWRCSMSNKKREKAMRTFVESVLPAEAHYAVNDSRMEALKDHVKQIERDIFVRSNSVHEYIKDMAGKCSQLISEMNNKTHDSANRTASLNPSSLGSSCSGTLSNSSNEGVSKDEIVARFEKTMESCEIKMDPGTVNNEEDVKPIKQEPPDTNDKEIKKENEDQKPSPSLDDKKVPSIKSADTPTDSKTEISENKEEEKEESEGSSSIKIWKQEELITHFISLLDKICADENSDPFRSPVNWQELELWNYPKIVTRPMDLSTIRQKILDGKYNDPWEIVDDFWLMFNNAWLFNKKNTKVYKVCTKLSEIFEVLIDPIMRSLGFCCGREYYFLPQLLNCCTVNMCRINRDVTYYQFKNEEPNKRPNLVLDRYQVCDRCFNDGCEYVGITDDTAIVNVAKSEFEKLKNNIKEIEPFVKCGECGRRWHKICACHSEDIWTKGFVCVNCTKNKLYKKPENRFTAKNLATCKLSTFLENRVSGFLKRNGLNNGEVVIRVLASADKSVEIKPGMKARYCDTKEISGHIPYRIKAIFAFQVIDGYEVCFFGLHVQEYGSECPHPNTRRVYVAYLDSVYFFQPKEYRTDMYHEILIGYMDYAKRLGYTAAHIWACPPSEGDDYIFHMHPPDQKIPKPKRLQEWYAKMLKKAHNERVIADYKDVYTEAIETKITCATDVPYFEGDYWPNQLEEIFKEIEDEEAKRKKDAANAGIIEDEGDYDSGGGNDDVSYLNNDKPSPDNIPGTPNSQASSSVGKKQKAKKRKIKKITHGSANGKRKRVGANGGVSTDPKAEISRKILDAMEKHKENFFSIRLHPPSIAANLGPIKDTDPLISSEMMECRDNFLNRSRDKHLEFSTLRRAKYSTLCMLYEIHTEDRNTVIYACNNCSETLEGVIRYHCKVCLEFDLCTKCHETVKHPHPMLKISADGKASGTGASAQETQREKINRLVKVLEHASFCRDANCRFSHCNFMKKLIEHSRVHNIPDKKKCPHCARVFTICIYHAKICTDSKCTLVHCAKMKMKMEQEQKQQRLQQLKMLRRRMAAMQRNNNGMTPNQMNNWQGNNTVSSPGIQGNPGPSPGPGMNSQPNTPYGGPGSAANSMQSPQQINCKMLPNVTNNSNPNSVMMMNNPSPGHGNLLNQAPYPGGNVQGQMRMSQPNHIHHMNPNSNPAGLAGNPSGNGNLLMRQNSNPNLISHQNNMSNSSSGNSLSHLHQQQHQPYSAPNRFPQPHHHHHQQPPFPNNPNNIGLMQQNHSHIDHQGLQQQPMMPPNTSNPLHINSGVVSSQQQMLLQQQQQQHRMSASGNAGGQYSQSNCPPNAMGPNSGGINGHPYMVQSSQQGSTGPGPGGNNHGGGQLTHEDVKTVQQVMSTFRQQNRSIQEFQMWLSNNPNYMKAWQYIHHQQQQQQFLNNQQQQQQQQQQNNWIPPSQQQDHMGPQFREKLGQQPNNLRQMNPNGVSNQRFIMPPGVNPNCPPNSNNMMPNNRSMENSSTSLSQLLSPNTSDNLPHPSLLQQQQHGQPPPGLNNMNAPSSTFHHHPNNNNSGYKN